MGSPERGEEEGEGDTMRDNARQCVGCLDGFGLGCMAETVYMHKQHGTWKWNGWAAFLFGRYPGLSVILCKASMFKWFQHVHHYASSLLQHSPQNFLNQRHIPLHINLPIRDCKPGSRLSIPLRSTHKDLPRSVNLLH